MVLKLGIIGAGHMGYLHLYSCIKMKKRVSVKGVADKSKITLKNIKKYGINTYEDYINMLENEDLDCVIISLPNFLKKESIQNVSEYNLDIFVDKPLARNYDEAIQIKNIINKKGNRLMVGTNYRYHPNIVKIKESLDEGKIGNIKIASYELIMNGPFSHPRTPRPVSDWYLDPEKSGGGAILDLGYHLLDLNQWFFGNSNVTFCVKNNIMNLPVEDSSTIITESIDDGVRSVFNVGWFSKMVFPDFNFRVNLHGSNGFLSSEKYAPGNLHLHAVREAIKNFMKRITFQEIDYLTYTYYYSSFYKILKDFLTYAESGSNFPSLQEQLNVMKNIDEAYRRGQTHE